MYFTKVAQCLLTLGIAGFDYVYGLFGDFSRSVALQIFSKHGHHRVCHCARGAQSQSDDFSPGVAWNSIATRSASQSHLSNWQGNSSPSFSSAVNPSLLVTAAALHVNRISFAGLNSDGSECSVIDFSTWLGLQVRHFLAAR